MPDKTNVVVEISKDTNTKYEYDTHNGTLVLDRCLISSMRYPVNYGFIPQTLALDNDPLDVVVYNNTPINTGVLVEVKPIAALDMNDNGHKDYKVVCVPTSHIREYRTLKDLESHWVSKTLNFFAHYKDLEDKKVTINGWLSKTATKKIIKESHLAWRSNNGK